MNVDLMQFDGDQEKDTWAVLAKDVVDLNSPECPEQVSVSELLKPSIASTLATLFLQWHRRAKQKYQFLSTDQLESIASKVVDSEKDIDEVPGVYIFCSIVDRTVLKVGQSNNMRRRIVREHLRKDDMSTDSLLIDYARRNWSVPDGAEWYEAMRDHEVTALIFPMRNSDERDRLLIESSLIGTLNPVMT
jgi:hypothetical protein